MMRSAIPKALLWLDKMYNRHTSFPRGRGACVRTFRWGAKNLGFKSPVLTLRSGLAFEYSPLVAADVLMRELLIKEVCEPIQTEMIRRMTKPNGVFIDIGANMGYFSVIAAKQVGPSGRVIACEPVAATYNLLSRNIHLNRLEGIITPLKVACFSTPGEMTMAATEDSGKSHLNESGKSNGEVVTVTTLDELVEKHGIDRIDFIKIDAEGSDFEVIKGGRRSIERFRPAIILETDHLVRFGASKTEVIHFFEAIAYDVSEISLEHTTDLLCTPRVTT